MRHLLLTAAVAAWSVIVGTPTVATAQNTSPTVPPIIDVHAHAMDESGLWAAPICPNTSKFLASDPRGPEASSGWAQEECSPKLYPAAKGQYMKEVLADMERLNVTAVVFGDPASGQKWRDAAPNRVIPGTSFSRGMQPGPMVPPAELRAAFTTGGFKVMGEIGLQYQGLSPSDMSVDPYFALAEELEIPVAIHMARAARAGRTSRCRSSGRRSATRSCSRSCWRAIPSCASR
jgi:hypothetical protein